MSKMLFNSCRNWLYILIITYFVYVHRYFPIVLVVVVVVVEPRKKIYILPHVQATCTHRANKSFSRIQSSIVTTKYICQRYALITNKNKIVKTWNHSLTHTYFQTQTYCQRVKTHWNNWDKKHHFKIYYCPNIASLKPQTINQIFRFWIALR